MFMTERTLEMLADKISYLWGESLLLSNFSTASMKVPSLSHLTLQECETVQLLLLEVSISLQIY